MPYYIAKTRSARAWYYIAVGLGIYFLSYLFGVMYARLPICCASANQGAKPTIPRQE